MKIVAAKYSTSPWIAYLLRHSNCISLRINTKISVKAMDLQFTTEKTICIIF